MAARRSIDRALANDDKNLALRTAADYCIWKAQHFRPTHHLQTQQNIIFDIIWEQGYVKLDKIVNTKIIQKLILPECIEYIRKSGNKLNDHFDGQIKVCGNGDDAHHIDERSQYIGQYTTDLLKPFFMAMFTKLGFAQV
jgi:hypothetical protein